MVYIFLAILKARLRWVLLGTVMSVNVVPGFALADEWPLNVITALSKDDPLYQGLVHFQKDIAKRTGGQITVRIFYGSQLGSDEDILEQARAGANVAVVIDGGRLSVYTPEFGILGAPYLVDDRHQARRLVTSDLFHSWEGKLKDKARLQVLSFNWWQGERHVLAQKAVAQPSDLHGLRLRTIGAPVFIETLRAMGASPTPLSWAEVYPALQQGVVDGAEAQHQGTYGSRLYEVVSHISKTAHINLLTGIVVGADWFEALPADLQSKVRQSALEAGDFATELTAERQMGYEKAMREQGTVINEIDRTPFIEATASVYSTLGYESLREQVLEAIQVSTDAPQEASDGMH